MTHGSPDDSPGDATTRVLVGMTVLAVVAGAITGFVGGAFRWLLVRADHLRLDIVEWSHELGGAGWVVPVVVSAVAGEISRAPGPSHGQPQRVAVQDEVQQAVLFSTTQSADQLKARIATAASEMQKELDPATFSVAYVGTQAKIKAAYTDDVALLPGGPKFKWLHELDVDMRRMAY